MATRSILTSERGFYGTDHDQSAFASASPSPTPAGDVELSPAELASRFGDAVWQVQAEGCGFLSTGTAFAVGPRTLVTNAHVVEDDATPVITSRDGRRDVSAVVAGADVDVDVAVLVVDQDLPVQPLSWTSASDLAEGDSLVALGYPVPDHSFTVTPATVMSFQSDGAVREALRLDGVIDKVELGRTRADRHRPGRRRRDKPAQQQRPAVDRRGVYA